RVLGMRLMRSMDFDEGRFSLYFLAMTRGEEVPDAVDRAASNSGVLLSCCRREPFVPSARNATGAARSTAIHCRSVSFEGIAR
ncbi:hypothetical protein ACV34P_32285, partial [Pseudomonas aeruginosa]